MPMGRITMPHRRYASRYRKRRTGAKKYQKKFKSNTKPRFVLFNNILQESIRTRLTYIETETLDPGTGSDYHQYLLNGVYRPDHTDGANTHQPAFMPEWSNYYNNYRVVGCKWTVTFRNHLAAADMTDLVQTTGPNSSAYLLDNPARYDHILYWEADNNATPKFTESTDRRFLRETGGQMSGVKWCYGPTKKEGVKTLTGSSNIRDEFVDKDHYLDATPISSDPTNELYLTVGAMSTDGNDTNQVKFDIKIEYLVEFTSLQDIDA